MLHPWRFRLPLWAAVAIVAVAYVARSVMRGLDFRLDMPTDAVALLMFAIVLGLVWYIRMRFADNDAEHAENDDSKRTLP